MSRSVRLAFVATTLAATLAAGCSEESNAAADAALDAKADAAVESGGWPYDAASCPPLPACAAPAASGPTWTIAAVSWTLGTSVKQSVSSNGAYSYSRVEGGEDGGTSATGAISAADLGRLRCLVETPATLQALKAAAPCPVPPGLEIDGSSHLEITIDGQSFSASPAFCPCTLGVVAVQEIYRILDAYIPVPDAG